jgi:hypothetical protein
VVGVDPAVRAKVALVDRGLKTVPSWGHRAEDRSLVVGRLWRTSKLALRDRRRVTRNLVRRRDVALVDRDRVDRGWVDQDREGADQDLGVRTPIGFSIALMRTATINSAGRSLRNSRSGRATCVSGSPVTGHKAADAAVRAWEDQVVADREVTGHLGRNDRMRKRRRRPLRHLWMMAKRKELEAVFKTVS